MLVRRVNWRPLTAVIILTLLFFLGGAFSLWVGEDLTFTLILLSIGLLLVVCLFLVPLATVFDFDKSKDKLATTERWLVLPSKRREFRLSEISQVNFEICLDEGTSYAVSLLLGSGETVNIAVANGLDEIGKRKLAKQIADYLGMTVVEVTRIP